jgi:hypothetical protein
MSSDAIKETAHGDRQEATEADVNDQVQEERMQKITQREKSVSPPLDDVKETPNAVEGQEMRDKHVVISQSRRIRMSL